MWRIYAAPAMPMHLKPQKDVSQNLLLLKINISRSFQFLDDRHCFTPDRGVYEKQSNKFRFPCSLLSISFFFLLTNWNLSKSN